MIKYNLMLCLFLGILTSKAQSFEYNIHAGIPLTDNRKINSYFFDLEVNKKFLDKINFGVGTKYSSICLNPSYSTLTYNSNTLSLFISIGRSFKIISKKIEFAPQIRVGYSYFNYTLNEFVNKNQYDNGLFLSPTFQLRYVVNKKFMISSFFCYNFIFNSFKQEIDFIIPANYINANPNVINNIDIGIGVTIKI